MLTKYLQQFSPRDFADILKDIYKADLIAFLAILKGFEIAQDEIAKESQDFIICPHCDSEHSRFNIHCVQPIDD